MYHSISEPRAEADVWGLQVHPERFRRQVRALVHEHEIVELAELARDLRRGRMRPNRVAITFDDGYANNLTVAAPILQGFGAPATLFVCTGFTDRRAFWWDQVVETVFTASRHASRASGPETGSGSVETFVSSFATDGAPRAPRELVLEIWQALRSLELAQIDLALAALDDLFRPTGQLNDLRPLHASEVGAAAACFTIGAHSVTHPLMSALDDERLAAEVVDSMRACETLTGRSVETFAYPYGDLNARVAREVARHVTLACTTREVAIGSASDPYRIPRIQVRDWSPEQLMSRLHEVTAA